MNTHTLHNNYNTYYTYNTLVHSNGKHKHDLELYTSIFHSCLLNSDLKILLLISPHQKCPLPQPLPQVSASDSPDT